MTRQPCKTEQSSWQIFRWPLVINCICLVGLVAALTGNGWQDFLSWACLGSAVLLIIYAYLTDSKGSVS